MSEYLGDIDTRIVFEDLPGSIKAFVRRVGETNCIVINSNLNQLEQYKAVLHELDHIMNGDIDKSLNVILLESKNKK